MNSTIIAFLLALIPGFAWLIYFLRKDVLPEPKRKILKVFLAGMVVCVPVLLFEIWLLNDLKNIELEYKLFLILKCIFVVGLIEEMFKYLTVRITVLKTSSIDEPIDIPLYMIVAALGFATIENIILFYNQRVLLLDSPFVLVFSRFLGATLLHVISSGIIGYFLAQSFYYLRQRRILLVFGFILGVVIHATFNFFLESSIIKETGSMFPSFALVLIIFLLFSFCLRKIKKLKSVCKL
ncbi:MAG: PrsW family glutamic-type intramembrane protease [Candidatus Pacebacteria bacterium]|nr:PrsW family glutamic-type intramembrane protease [Candidatus Paceibacterota bacterium]MDD4074126.1 PrsW family glutamic-type intramembrane protease [Candidatus Paceibacterota bacterium]